MATKETTCKLCGQNRDGFYPEICFECDDLLSSFQYEDSLEGHVCLNEQRCEDCKEVFKEEGQELPGRYYIHGKKLCPNCLECLNEWIEELDREALIDFLKCKVWQKEWWWCLRWYLGYLIP